MLYEHLPDWILSSEAYKGLVKSPVVGFIPLWNHAWALLVEICCIGLVANLMSRRDLGRAALAGAVLGLHAVWFIGTCFMLDRGVTFYYASAIWNIVALTFAAMAFGAKWHQGRRSPEQSSLSPSPQSSP